MGLQTFKMFILSFVFSMISIPVNMCLFVLEFGIFKTGDILFVFLNLLTFLCVFDLEIL